MRLHNVVLTLVPGGGAGSMVAVDGHDLGGVTGIRLTQYPGEYPQLELELRVVEVTALSGETEVYIDSSAAETLKKIGWTPPPGTED